MSGGGGGGSLRGICMGRCGILDVGVSVAVCGAAPKTRRHFAGASRYDSVLVIVLVPPPN